ncbi:mucin-2 isoform X2 [Diachasmimorpha longicaudata]|uniref:mucin-2 isoform X2 n=1 Tax=Diachasmimorpha longicaudata TaxID=58733 RepID=UPI0030B8715D
MDQTQRPADDFGAGRGTPTLEKQPPNLLSGVQPRPQGPPPQRYPINNGSAGPRLGGGQPPPSLPRLDSRSTLGAPTGSPTQFPRPPFGPPRPPGAPPGQFPRGPPSQTNSGQIRFPPGSSGARGPFPPGQRPTFTSNQVRPQRPSLDPGGPGQPRFLPPGAGFQFNPDNRLPTPRITSETPVANPQGGNPIPTPRESPDVKSSVRLQPKIRMETNGPNQLTNQQNDKESVDSVTPNKRPTSQTRLADEDDDDDVVMDNEKDSKSQKSASNESLVVSPGVQKTPTPEPRTPTKNEISATPSPASSKAPTPAPEEERSKSRLSDNIRSPDDGENEEMSEKSRPTSALSSRSSVKSPTKSIGRTLDLPSPGGGRSPELKSPVVGFDNGRPRSLTARSRSPASSPGASYSPKTPGTPKSEKRTTFMDAKEGSKTERSRPGTPGVKSKPGTPVRSKPGTPVKSPTRPQTPKSGMKRSTSARSIKSDGGSDSGANQTTPNGSPTTNGVAVSPTKKLPIKSKEEEKPKTAGSPIKSSSKSVKSLPRTPEAGSPSTADKKTPMNKVQVGAAPSPNLKTIRSKIGSLDNASYKPGGGKVKIENRKLDFSKAQPKIAAKNDKYMPSGGDKKIQQVKLQWNAKPKVGSFDNATYRPGGGDKKIETVKLDFKDKAKPKVGSKDNAKHMPGGGAIKTSPTNKSPSESQCESENGSEEPNPPPSTPTRTRPSSAVSPVTPRALISSLQARSPDLSNPKRAPTPGPGVIEKQELLTTRAKTPPQSPVPPVRSIPPSNLDSKSPDLLNPKSSPTPAPEVTEKQEFSTPRAKTPQQSPVHSIPPSSSDSRSPGLSNPKGIPISAPRATENEASLTPPAQTPQQSPVSSRPPSNLDSKSSGSSKSSSSGVHLPQLPNLLAPNVSFPHTTDPPEIKLPKLVETSSLSTRTNSA